MKPYISEKSIIRPTFSYLGNFTISDTVFRQITEYLAQKEKTIYKVLKTRAESRESGPYIYLEVMVEYGYNVVESVENFKSKVIKEISKITTMDVQSIEIVIKGIHIPEDKRKGGK